MTCLLFLHLPLMFMLTPPYTRSQQCHPHEAHLAAFQQASSLFCHSHFSQRASTAADLQLLSITTGPLSRSLLNFLPQHLVWTSLRSRQRTLWAARDETHAHEFMCIHTPIKTQLLKVSSLNTHTQWVYFALPQNSLCVYVLWCIHKMGVHQFQISLLQSTAMVWPLRLVALCYFGRDKKPHSKTWLKNHENMTTTCCERSLFVLYRSFSLNEIHKT